jgi:demethylmenaquinone methyltransferase/2-methoxy-6-polyprenyl-1,4-benzoquinol methylase
MIEDTPKDLVPTFFNNTANSYDSIVHWTTFGRDSFWKKKILEQLSAEKSILDLACGTGILTEQINQKIPQAKIVGVDITKSYLEKAKEKLNSSPNISFLNQDAENLDLEQKFDCITASYLPKYCKPSILVKTCFEHLNDGGKIILHDFTYPKNRFVRKMWDLYFKVLFLMGFFIPSWNDVFVNLPSLIRTSNWVKDYEKEMIQFGLKTNIQELTWDSSVILTGTKIA